MLNKKEKNILVSLLYAIFLIPLTYSFYFKVTPAVDARAYDNIAWNIAQGNGYRESLDGALADDQAIVRVGPGFELFLSGIFKIFGHNYGIVWVAHALMLTISAFIVFSICHQFLGLNFASSTMALALVGFSPDLITIQSMLMTETLGIFLILLVVYIFFIYRERNDRSVWFSILLGLLLSAAVMTRTTLALVFLILLFNFIKNNRTRDAVVMVIVFIIPFIPWGIRNHQVYGEWIFTNAAFGYNFFGGNHSGATGEQGYSALDQYAKESGFIGANRRATGEAIGFIVGNPLEFMSITLKRISIYFSFARPTGFWFHLDGTSKALTLMLSSIYSVVIFVTGILGIQQIKNLKENKKETAWYLFVILFLMPLSIIFLVVETRYRFISYPFLAIFAGLAWQNRPNLRAIAWTSGILILNTAIDLSRNFSRFLDKISNL